MLIKSLALSHLHYANSFLMGLPAKTIKIMPNMQNLAANVILGKQKSDSSKECLKVLHWLPNKIQIQLQSMHPGIQVLTCNGTNLSHQANQIKTTKKTRIKVRKHKQHSRSTQNKKESICIMSLRHIWTKNMESTTRLTANNN